MTPDYWQKAQAHLSKNCPVMRGLIGRYAGEILQARGDAFYTLARSIVGQQISVKAADSVWAKCMAQCVPMSPEAVQNTPDEVWRNCGLSRQKILYLRNIANFFLHPDTPRHWHNHSDSEVMKALTSIKGIGSWTAEMFLIFHLLRPDILPLKDIGLLKAIDLYFTDGKRVTAEEYQRIAAPWAPYRSVATWYLWRALDPVPVAY